MSTSLYPSFLFPQWEFLKQSWYCYVALLFFTGAVHKVHWFHWIIFTIFIHVKGKILTGSPYHWVPCKYFTFLFIFLALNQGVFKASELKSSSVGEFWKIEKSTYLWKSVLNQEGLFMRGEGDFERNQRYSAYQNSILKFYGRMSRHTDSWDGYTYFSNFVIF